MTQMINNAAKATYLKFDALAKTMQIAGKSPTKTKKASDVKGLLKRIKQKNEDTEDKGKEQEPTFDLPVPGMGMTHEVGARPWQQPAQYTKVDDVAQYYISKMQDDAFATNVLNLLETKMPVTMIANAMQTVNMMNGVHSLDVGMLSLPIIMEMLMFIADSEGIEYVTGVERNIEAELEDTTIELAVDSATNDTSSMTPEEEMTQEDTPMAEETMPTGLMARRG